MCFFGWWGLSYMHLWSDLGKTLVLIDNSGRYRWFPVIKTWLPSLALNFVTNPWGAAPKIAKECQKLNLDINSGPIKHINHTRHPCKHALYCQHLCGSLCHPRDQGCNTECKKSCCQSCIHYKCPRPCSATCALCLELCLWKCAHYECLVSCGSVCWLDESFEICSH